MVLSKTRIIDAVGICKRTGDVVLSLVDEEDWEDNEGHLNLLQDKLTNYLRFIESGDMHKAYPKAQGRTARIEVHGRCRPSESGQHFLKETAERIEDKGIVLHAIYDG